MQLMNEKRYITKYRASIFGSEEDKERAVKTLGSALPGIKTYDLIEPDVWALEKNRWFF